MVKFIIKRLLLALLTVFIVATLTFFLMHLVPGGPFQSEKISERMLEIINENTI